MNFLTKVLSACQIQILIAQLKSELRKSKQLNEDLESSLIRLQKEMEELKFQLELEKQKHLTISTELNRYSEVMSPPLSTSTTSKVFVLFSVVDFSKFSFLFFD
jgi:predicted  nucleic acid-binding Zn-ribbon protein